MGILDVALTDQGYEALKKKLLETYSVQPTLSNQEEKTTVDWHCLEHLCLMKNAVFDRRERWLKHHQRFHNRMCGSDKDYPREKEAKHFIQERDRREGAAIQGTDLGGAESAIRPNSAAPSSSTAGALRVVAPNRAAPNPPPARARRNSASGAQYRRGPYRLCANKAARRKEQPDRRDVAQQNEPESFGTLEADRREILMWQLNSNLQAVSRINADSERIMQILAGSKRPRETPNTRAQGNPAATSVETRALATTSRRPSGPQAHGQSSKFVNAASRQAPTVPHLNVGSPANVEVEAPVFIFQATPFQPQSQAALALSIGGPTANSNEGPGPLSIAGS